MTGIEVLPLVIEMIGVKLLKGLMSWRLFEVKLRQFLIAVEFDSREDVTLLVLDVVRMFLEEVLGMLVDGTVVAYLNGIRQTLYLVLALHPKY